METGECCTIHFETVDVMRVQDGKITDHWGVGNLLSLMQQIGGWTPPGRKTNMNIVKTNAVRVLDGLGILGSAQSCRH